MSPATPDILKTKTNDIVGSLDEMLFSLCAGLVHGKNCQIHDVSRRSRVVLSHIAAEKIANDYLDVIEKAPIDLLQAVQTGAKDKSQSEQGEIKTTKKVVVMFNALACVFSRAASEEEVRRVRQEMRETGRAFNNNIVVSTPSSVSSSPC